MKSRLRSRRIISAFEVMNFVFITERDGNPEKIILFRILWKASSRLESKNWIVFLEICFNFSFFSTSSSFLPEKVLLTDYIITFLLTSAELYFSTSTNHF